MCFFRLIIDSIQTSQKCSLESVGNLFIDGVVKELIVVFILAEFGIDLIEIFGSQFLVLHQLVEALNLYFLNALLPQLCSEMVSSILGVHCKISNVNTLLVKRLFCLQFKGLTNLLLSS